MSYENKGTLPVVVFVTRTPDRSGNFICDGTDDDVQIQAAIDYVIAMGGGIVQLGYGTFVCIESGYAPITIGSNVWLRGMGMGATKLYWPTDNIPSYRGAIENINAFTNTPDTYMMISDLEMEGPGLAPVGPNVQLGIQWAGVQYSRVTRVRLHEWYGFMVRIYGDTGSNRGESHYVVLEECVAYSSAFNFMTFGSAVAGDVSHCIVKNNFITDTDTGISFFNAQECIASGNTMWNNNNATTYNNFIDIAIEGGAGIPTKNHAIIGNLLNGSKAGIAILSAVDAQDITVVGNVLRDHTGTAALTSDGARVTISGNLVDCNNDAAYGIKLGPSGSGSLVVGNAIYNAEQVGIGVGGGSTFNNV